LIAIVRKAFSYQALDLRAGRRFVRLSAGWISLIVFEAEPLSTLCDIFHSFDRLHRSHTKKPADYHIDLTVAGLIAPSFPQIPLTHDSEGGLISNLLGLQAIAQRQGGVLCSS
jgi:hypothetical protein